MKYFTPVLLTFCLAGCITNGYESPDYLAGQLTKSEPVNGKLYCYYRIVDLENNVIFSTVPAKKDQPCTKNVKINIANDEIVWLK